ncbi:unnamed protein product [Tuber aestivum]|uniref:Uncharacterized protein n=1 Tax=Tuber aestivum TaxID=59557 RepID=A0A292Q1N4_9PEZI|nr:unnamed protein product [Tuber aestivum]
MTAIFPNRALVRAIRYEIAHEIILFPNVLADYHEDQITELVEKIRYHYWHLVQDLCLLARLLGPDSQLPVAGTEAVDGQTQTLNCDHFPSPPCSPEATSNGPVEVRHPPGLDGIPVQEAGSSSAATLNLGDLMEKLSLQAVPLESGL